MNRAGLHKRSHKLGHFSQAALPSQAAALSPRLPEKKQAGNVGLWVTDALKKLCHTVCFSSKALPQEHHSCKISLDFRIPLQPVQLRSSSRK